MIFLTLELLDIEVTSLLRLPFSLFSFLFNFLKSSIITIKLVVLSIRQSGSFQSSLKFCIYSWPVFFSVFWDIVWWRLLSVFWDMVWWRLTSRSFICLILHGYIHLLCILVDKKKSENLRLIALFCHRVLHIFHFKISCHKLP